MSRRYKLAVHESAHAIAAIHLDRTVIEVAITDTSGVCNLAPAPVWDFVTALNEAILALVGEMAEEKVPVPPQVPATMPRPVPIERVAEEIVEAELEAVWPDPWSNPFDDATLAERILRGAALSDEEGDAFLVVAKTRAAAAIADPRFMAQVLNLAGILCSVGRLDGPTVCNEMERVDRRLEFAALKANEENGDGYDPPQAA